MKRLALLVFCFVVMLSGMSVAATRTPLGSENHIMEGFCADIDEGKAISLHFCASQHSKAAQVSMLYTMYVEIYGPTNIELDKKQIVLVHAVSRNELPYQIDATIKATVQDSLPARSRLTVHVLEVPWVVVKLLRQGQPIEIYVSINGKKHWFKPTREELKEIRMIANLDPIVEPPRRR